MCENSGSQPAYKQPPDSYLGGHQASHNYSAMWWHGNDGPGSEVEQGEGGITARAGRQARKRKIILLCTLCRLKLHSSDTRQIEKSKKMA